MVMMVRATCFLFVFLVSAPWARSAAAQIDCRTEPLAVQVLGSGGPFAGPDRAASSYVVWVNGASTVMIDAGWGALMRFREAGAQFDQLALLAISHLHPDHVSDLPALLWGERGRGAPLPISGPSGTPQFPDLGTFLTRMFSPTSGAFQVLEGTLRSGGSGPSLEATIVDISRPEPAPILVQGSLRVTALGVPHGNTPSLAYRVQVGDRTIVFGSDQNGGNEKFIEFARDADALVMHFPLSSRAPEARRRVHAPPVVVGRLAKEAAVQHLILSHFSKAPSDSAPEGESLSDLAASVAEVRTQYRGRVSTSRDLECFPVP